MENQDKKKLTAEEQEALNLDIKQTENSKNTGSSQIDTHIHRRSRNYGRTTGSLGVGHEPGTTPGIGE